VEAAADWETLGSPETYVGYARAQNIASPGGIVFDQPHVYRGQAELGLNQWALSGDWTVGSQTAICNEAGGRIACRFHARDVNLVLGSGELDGPIPFQIRVDGEAPGPAHGDNVDDEGNGTIDEARLYQLIREPSVTADRTFEITFLEPGARAYVFTFG
jgi:hypothetical protein